MHNWDVLAKRVADCSDDDACKDLAALLSALRASPELHGYFRTRDASNISFETLWTLFPPRQMIVAAPFMDIPQILRVEDAPTPRRGAGLAESYQIWAWQWDWDGKMMVKVHYRLSIPRFQGSRRIVDLPYYPLSFHDKPGPEALRASVRQRSRSFLEATIHYRHHAYPMFLYNGYAYTHSSAFAHNGAASVGCRLFPPRLVEKTLTMARSRRITIVPTLEDRDPWRYRPRVLFW